MAGRSLWTVRGGGLALATGSAGVVTINMLHALLLTIAPSSFPSIYAPEITIVGGRLIVVDVVLRVVCFSILIAGSLSIGIFRPSARPNLGRLGWALVTFGVLGFVMSDVFLLGFIRQIIFLQRNSTVFVDPITGLDRLFILGSVALTLGVIAIMYGELAPGRIRLPKSILWISTAAAIIGLVTAGLFAIGIRLQPVYGLSITAMVAALCLLGIQVFREGRKNENVE